MSASLFSDEIRSVGTRGSLSNLKMRASDAFDQIGKRRTTKLSTLLSLPFSPFLPLGDASPIWRYVSVRSTDSRSKATRTFANFVAVCSIDIPV